MDGVVRITGRDSQDGTGAAAPTAEILNLIVGSGQTRSGTTFTQLQMAVENQCIYENNLVFFENSRVLSFD